jgi:N utilization substance protein B
MISRRLIRVKAFQVLYAHFTAGEKSITKAENELFFSIEKTYDLYFSLMLLVLDTVEKARQKMESAKQKRMPTKEDLMPNTRFVDNQLIKQLERNLHLHQHADRKKLSWVNHPELVTAFYQHLTNSEIFQEYMSQEHTDYATDKKFVTRIFTNLLVHFENLHQELEEMSVFWNDDLEFVVSVIAKSLRKFKPNSDEHVTFLPQFKDEEDKEFARKLVRKAVVNYPDNHEIIAGFIQNWDVERVAHTDLLIMNMALTELMQFPSIPVKVTLDEYIDIAKYYSTQKSNTFINGILDKATAQLREEGRIQKQGRGLMGEV